MEEAGNGNLQQRIWKQVAFLGRYAHQPANVTLSLPTSDMARLVAETSKIIESEHQDRK